MCAYLRLSHLAALSRGADAPDSPRTRAAVLPALFATPHGVEIDLAVDTLGPLYAELETTGLVAARGKRVVSRQALIPTRTGVIVCDHQDGASDSVAMADESSYHLLGCLPHDIRTWLDVGTGNGFLPLAHGRGAAIGSDVHRRSLSLARLGSHLSGRTGDQFLCASGCSVDGNFDLITFNAPLPAHLGSQRSSYRRTSGDNLMEGFWSSAPDRLRGGGEIIVHTFLEEGELPLQLDRGDVIVARYTAKSEPTHFGVVRWRPSEPSRVVHRLVPLSRDKPLLERQDIE